MLDLRPHCFLAHEPPPPPWLELELSLVSRVFASREAQIPKAEQAHPVEGMALAGSLAQLDRALLIETDA